MNTSRNILSKCTLLACLLFPLGCATILSQAAFIDGKPVGEMFGDPEVVIYGGFRADLQVLETLSSDRNEQVEQPGEMWMYQIGFSVDLVLSFSAETES